MGWRSLLGVVGRWRCEKGRRGLDRRSAQEGVECDRPMGRIRVKRRGRRYIRVLVERFRDAQQSRRSKKHHRCSWVLFSFAETHELVL